MLGLSTILVGASVSVHAEEDDAQRLARAVESFRQGDSRAAADDLEPLHHRRPDDADIALLLGICRYRLGEPYRAEPLLRAAARAHDPETVASAQIFLGLIADERGELDAARGYLDRARMSPTGDLADSGRGLLRRTAPRVVSLVLLLRPEFDSNVPLLPTAPTPSARGGQTADGDVLLLVALSLRPVPRIGLTIDETAAYRQQFTLYSYDLFANTLALSYAYLGSADRVKIGYAFDVVTLGPSLLDLGHAVEAAYRRRIVRDFGVGLQYTFRYRTYYASGYQPFTGPSHTGALELSWGTAERPFEIGAAYLITRDDTADPTFSATAQGARLRLRARLARRLDLSLMTWVLNRPFDLPDPTAGPRHDVQIYGDASLAIDLHRHLGLIVGGSLLRNLSTVADFDYLKLTAYLGLAVGYAGP
jgi:hypothetical protein